MPSARARQLCPSAVFLQATTTPCRTAVPRSQIFQVGARVEDLARRGVPRRHRIDCSATASRSATASAPTSATGWRSRARSGVAPQVPGQDGLGRGQAAPVPTASSWPGVFGGAGGGGGLPAPAAGAPAVGVGPSTYERLSAGSGSRPSATSPGCRRGAPGRPRRPGRCGCSSWPPASTIGRSRANAWSSRSSHETFAYDLHDRADIRTAPRRMADGVATSCRPAGLGADDLLKVRDATFDHQPIRTLPRAVDTRGRDRRRGRSDDGPGRGRSAASVCWVWWHRSSPAERAAAGSTGSPTTTTPSSGARRARRSTWSGALRERRDRPGERFRRAVCRIVRRDRRQQWARSEPSSVDAVPRPD